MASKKKTKSCSTSTRRNGGRAKDAPENLHPVILVPKLAGKDGEHVSSIEVHLHGRSFHACAFLDWPRDFLLIAARQRGGTSDSQSISDYPLVYAGDEPVKISPRLKSSLFNLLLEVIGSAKV